jgi:hypothetical protein
MGLNTGRRAKWLSAAIGGLLLLTGCSSGLPGKPGAPPINTDASVGASSESPIGASEQTPSDAAARAGQQAAMATLVKPFTCPKPTVTVTDAGTLTAALKSARSGTVIALQPGTYSGRFQATAKAPPSRPIYLCGSRDAVLDAGSIEQGYGLHLDGAQNWRLSGFTVRNGQKGVMVDHGESNVLQALVVTQTGEEAVHLRNRSTGNVVRGLRISETGRFKPKFGEGLYVGTAQSNWCSVSGCQPDRSDGNQLLDNTISSTTAESVDIKEGTSSGVISGNTFNGAGLKDGADSWVDIKGSYWTISDNKGTDSPKDGFQTHVILDGWGTGNVFSGNTAVLGHGTGVGYYLNHELTNRVACDNTETGAAQGLSNVACQG